MRAILNFLEGHPSDVIVLATHGREGLPRWLHGSVAEPIARAAESTTLFIRQGARGFVTPDNGAIQLRRVLIPVDRQPRPTYALRAAWDIVRMLGAQGTILQLLHVGSELDPSSVEVDPGTWSSVEHSSRSGEVVERDPGGGGRRQRRSDRHGDRRASGLFGCAPRQHDRTRGAPCALPGARGADHFSNSCAMGTPSPQLKSSLACRRARREHRNGGWLGWHRWRLGCDTLIGASSRHLPSL